MFWEKRKLPETPLSRLSREVSVFDPTLKPDIYWKEYETILAPVRERELRILELGVFDGTSMLVWERYLPNATIVGLDLKERPERLPNSDRLKYVQGAQDDIAALDEAARLAGGQFDLIIDDCAHIARVAKRSFDHLFPRHLKPGGHYVVEDICTAFLKEYDDGRPFVEPPTRDEDTDITVFESHQNGLVGFAKQLIDHMNAELATGNASPWSIERMVLITNFFAVQKAS